jgi:hypothetical protein
MTLIKQRLSFSWYTLPAIVWTICISIASSNPPYAFPAMDILEMDKLIHLVI